LDSRGFLNRAYETRENPCSLRALQITELIPPRRSQASLPLFSVATDVRLVASDLGNDYSERFDAPVALRGLRLA
jgi:hypothetical protein